MTTKAMTGYFPRDDEALPDAPEFKGSVVIKWGPAASKGAGGRVMPGCLTAVYDEEDGALIPCSGVTVRATATGLIVADVAVHLGKDGQVLRDAARIARESDGVPATFPFLVAEMRVRP